MMQRAAHNLRVAIVGAGQMARHHVRALSSITMSHDIVAIFDPDEAGRRALRDVVPGASGHTELETSLLRGKADVVHICTPPSTHAALARIALEAGCHVYVEKPFAETGAEAEALIALANERGLQVCAGHQLLFEEPTRKVFALQESLKPIVHVESYFSFRPSRSGMSTEAQLRDILPHPLYCLLGFLEQVAPKAESRATSIQVGKDGTVHALIESGGMLGTLIVTLTGRPVESYLRVVGVNGSATADYVRGIALQAVGPGSSSMDKVLQPFRTARQLSFGSARSLARRLVKRQRTYPGLAEILETFYRSIAYGEDPPLSPHHILSTVRLLEEISTQVEGAGTRGSPGKPSEHPAAASAAERPEQPRSDTHAPRRRGLVVTGGTGFLGREVVRHLREREIPVRVLSRRLPPRWERVEGVDYQPIDLGLGCPPNLLEGFDGLIHCAAETRDGWDEHRRNSITATELLLKAANAAGVSKFVHVSSLAVLASPVQSDEVREGIGLATGDRSVGPYVWGKLHAERRAQELSEELGVDLKVVRPGPIVDYDAFEPPGRLGRRIGNVFVAVGPRAGLLAVVERKFAARCLVWVATNFDAAPAELNLLNPDLPTRRELIGKLKARNPGLRVIWLPRPALRGLSFLGVVAQRVVRRGKDPIRIDRAFASERYDTSRIARLEPLISEATVVVKRLTVGRGSGP